VSVRQEEKAAQSRGGKEWGGKKIQKGAVRLEGMRTLRKKEKSPDVGGKLSAEGGPASANSDKSIEIAVSGRKNASSSRFEEKAPRRERPHDSEARRQPVGELSLPFQRSRGKRKQITPLEGNEGLLSSDISLMKKPR